MLTLIKTNQLNLSFGPKQVLKDISIAIPTGKITAIIGPNGSGKTSLLNCLSGVNRSYQGEVKIADQSLSELSQQNLARQLGYLHQHMPANLFLTVRQVVELGLTPNLSPWASIKQEHQERVDSALAEVNLTGFCNRSFDSLSGGEKQRVLIAKVIVQNPAVLLLDEPTNHLDIKYQIDVMTLIAKLNMTVICCIHDLNLAASYADYIICLNDGEVVFQGDTSDILTSENIASVYGVNCAIDTHLITGAPHVQFDMGVLK